MDCPCKSSAGPSNWTTSVGSAEKRGSRGPCATAGGSGWTTMAGRRASALASGAPGRLVRLAAETERLVLRGAVRLQGTILQEHWRVALRRRYFTSRAALQRSLDGFMQVYNHARPHQGYRLRGRPHPRSSGAPLGRDRMSHSGTVNVSETSA